MIASLMWGVALVVFFVAFPTISQWFFCRSDANQGRAVKPWYEDGWWLVVTLVWMADRALNSDQTPDFVWFLTPTALYLAARTIWLFYKQRPQFSLGNLFWATFLLACISSVIHYLPTLITSILILVALVWTDSRQIRRTLAQRSP